jgi:hypothetical protein
VILNIKEPVFVEMQWSMMMSYSFNFERAYVRLDDGIQYEFFIDNVPTVLNRTRKDWRDMTEYECRFISTAVPVGKHPIIVAFGTSNPEFIVSNYYCLTPAPTPTESPTCFPTYSPTESPTPEPSEIFSRSRVFTPSNKFSASENLLHSFAFLETEMWDDDLTVVITKKYAYYLRGAGASINLTQPHRW